MSSATKDNFIACRAVESDYPEVFRLWQLAFASPYNVFEPQDYVDNQLSRLYVFREIGGPLASCAGYIEFETTLAGQPVKCAGIAAVATPPSYRRLGLTRQMFDLIMDDLDRRKITLACLWPFDYRFYEGLGFACTDTKLEVLANIDKLPRSHRAVNYKEIEPTFCKALSDLHQQWCMKHNLSFVRDEKRWGRMLARAGSEVMVLAHSHGYMLISLQEKELVVSEWCYLSDQAFFDGLSLLAQFDSQFEKVRFSLRKDHYDLLLRSGLVSSYAEVSLKPGMMSRIAHLPSFISLLERSGTTIDTELLVALGDHPGKSLQVACGYYNKLPEELSVLSPIKDLLADKVAFSVERY